MKDTKLTSIKVRYPQNDPPLISMIVASYSDLSKLVEFTAVKKGLATSEAKLIPIGETLITDEVIARFIARSFNKLSGSCPLVSSHVDFWLRFSERLKGSDIGGLNSHFALRTYVVQPNLTIADIALYVAFIKRGLDAFLEENPHVKRWFNFINQQNFVQSARGGLFQKEEKDKPVKSSITGTQGAYLELRDVDKIKTVCTRFPPEPSGYLHIGHAKAALLNSYYAQKYNGKLLIRFDDTNPAKEKDEYVESIIEDLQTLGIKGESLSYTSQWFDKIQEYAEELLKRGFGYVDKTPHDIMKTQRMEGVCSEFRNNTVEENLRLWKEMLKGSEEGKQCLLRAKIDTGEGPMQSVNRCLRDPGLYRCVDAPHHRTGTKYKAYPLYDFACPIVDSLEGVTHALRSNEYHDRNVLYDWILEKLSLRRVYIEDFSRLNFTYTLLSKRKLQWFVDNKKVTGWDDPSFPTIRGIMRHGMTLEALREFVISQGVSKTDINMDMGKLWAINKKFIDPIVPRYFAVNSDTAVLLKLSNVPEPSVRSVKRHKKNDTLGNKTISYSSDVYLEGEDAQLVEKDEEITLMDWGNCYIRNIQKDESGKVVLLEGELHLEGSVKTTKKKLHWLDAKADLPKVRLLDFDALITVPKLAPEMEFADCVNNDFLTTNIAYADPNVRLLPHGTSIQFERKGYYKLDKAYFREGDTMDFVLIPDGKPRQRKN